MRTGALAALLAAIALPAFAGTDLDVVYGDDIARLNDRHALGLEYHVEAGKIGDAAPRNKRSEMAYLTWDARIASQQLSVALGHGATQGSDRWAVRIGIELDD